MFYGSLKNCLIRQFLITILIASLMMMEINVSNKLFLSFINLTKDGEHQCVDLQGQWVTKDFKTSKKQEDSDPTLSDVFPIFAGDHQVQWKPSNLERQCRRLRHFNRAALNRCLVSRDSSIMMSGDSTTREVWEYIATNMLGYPNIDTMIMNPQHHCDAELGYGCFSCQNGCKSKDFKETPFCVSHWMDWEIPVAMMEESGIDRNYNFQIPIRGPQISFTWKPDMFSLEEISRFETATKLEEVKWGAILVNKGVHLAKELSSLELFDNQNVWDALVSTQAKQMANHLKKVFATSKTLFFWRESYYNHKDSKAEELLARHRGITRVIFEDAGFIILPGFNITSPESNVVKGKDGLHQHESVQSLIVDMILSHIC